MKVRNLWGCLKTTSATKGIGNIPGLNGTSARGAARNSQHLLRTPHQPSPHPSGEGFFERRKHDCTQCAVGCRRYPKRVGENWVEILIFAQEVRQQEKPFERWKPRARAAVPAQCRQVLELSLRDGVHSGTWFYCVDLAEKDPQAAVARRWLNFVDESLRNQIHPKIREQRPKEKRK